jgi:Uma2 family endonuclease
VATPPPIGEENLMLDDATMNRMTGHQHTDDAQESKRKLTYADFVRFPSDDGRRHELIQGVHVVSAAPSQWHQILLARLMFEIEKHFEESRVGLVVPGIDCKFSLFDVICPDLVVVLANQQKILTKRGAAKGAPAIVIEILSPSTRRRDRGIKRALCERAGVREYWIVDPDQHTVTVHAFSKGRVAKPELLRADDEDVLSTEILPGFELRLRRLFRDLLS